MNTPPPVRGYIREKELRKRVPVAHSTLWKWVRDGLFPAPVKLSEGVTAWPVAAIDEWEASIAAGGATKLGDPS